MQVAIVGAGASVGKEGAPREVGALLAGRLAKGFSLALKETKSLDRLWGWSWFGCGLSGPLC